MKLWLSRHICAIMLIIAIFAISTGGLIYISYRPLSLYMFKWLNLNDGTSWLMSLRTMMDNKLPNWVIYELPGGLWSLAYVILICSIWDFNIKRCWIIASFIPLLGIGSELMQALNFLPGQFDWWDCIMYACGAVFGFLLSQISHILITKQYE